MTNLKNTHAHTHTHTHTHAQFVAFHNLQLTFLMCCIEQQNNIKHYLPNTK